MNTTNNQLAHKEKNLIKFNFAVMGASVLLLVFCSLYFHGWISASIWGYGFTAVYVIYAFWAKDKILWRILFFGVCTGFAELLADHWLVAVYNELVYPQEPMLVSSPLHMPFSWTVVLTQLAIIIRMLKKHFNMVTTMLIMMIMGACLIPFYEYLAIGSKWWYYQNTPMFLGIVPYSIIIAEGLLMMPLPLIIMKSEKIKISYIPLLGLFEGFVMWISVIISHFIVSA
jgi:hypothetical protein